MDEEQPRRIACKILGEVEEVMGEETTQEFAIKRSDWASGASIALQDGGDRT